MTRLTGAALLVAGWLGAALLTVAVVAPGAFAVLPTRAMAGDMVGRVLPVVFVGAIVVPTLVLVIAPSTRRAWLSVVAILCALSAAVGALGFVNPRIAALRLAAAVPIDQLRPDDPRRTMFGVWHGVSVALLGLAMLAHVALLFALVRGSTRATSTSSEAQ
jgi:hypothetical protein